MTVAVLDKEVEIFDNYIQCIELLGAFYEPIIYLPENTIIHLYKQMKLDDENHYYKFMEKLRNVTIREDCFDAKKQAIFAPNAKKKMCL